MMPAVVVSVVVVAALNGGLLITAAAPVVVCVVVLLGYSACLSCHKWQIHFERSKLYCTFSSGQAAGIFSWCVNKMWINCHSDTEWMGMNQQRLLRLLPSPTVSVISWHQGYLCQRPMGMSVALSLPERRSVRLPVCPAVCSKCTVWRFCWHAMDARQRTPGHSLAKGVVLGIAQPGHTVVTIYDIICRYRGTFVCFVIIVILDGRK